MLSYHHGQSNALLSAGQEQYYSRPLVLDSSKNKPLTCWNTWDELTRMSAEELQDPENDVNGNVLCSRTHALLIMKPRYSRKLFMTSSSVGTLRFWLFIAQQEFVGLHVMFSNFQYATKPRRSGKIHSNPSFFNSLKISRDIRDGKLSYLPAFMPDSQADALPSIILQFSKISRDVRDGKLSYLFYMLLRRQKDSTPHL